MRKLGLFSFFLLYFLGCGNEDDCCNTSTSELYFPPFNSQVWETTPASELGWNTSNLANFYTFLESKNTRAFLVLKDGKIVLEKYFGNNITQNGNFNASSVWYWASAGKTLTSYLVGIAQQDNILHLSHKTSQYLGIGWTSLPLEKENLITIRHQLTMTTGLDDGVSNNHCTAPTCLVYSADAGTRWAYHNAPYTLLDKVIENASGQSLNAYTNAKLHSKIGMNGSWIQVGEDNVYFSTARDMARFGLFMLNQGTWDGQNYVHPNYFNEMTQTSQNLNLSYGYLWWLNGKASFMLPESQTVFSGKICPPAEDRMFSAIGKNSQILDIVPSQNLVVVRLGDDPDTSNVPTVFHNEMWNYLQSILN